MLARSDGAGLVQLGLHGGLIGVSAAAVHASTGSVWIVPAMLVYGILLVFLFAPLHECIHRSAFATRWLNDILAWVCGAVLMLPPAYFRAFHFTHHRYTQDPQRDPEVVGSRPRTWVEYVWCLSGLPYWIERVSSLVRHGIGRVNEPFIDPGTRPSVIREARVFMALYGMILAGSVALGSDVLSRYWLVPVLLGQPFLRAFLLAEHWGCALEPDMRLNSRTTLTNPGLRRLCWNMCYHTAHHLSPGVPFHALPAYHAQISGGMLVQACGYLSVHRQMVRFLPRR